MRRQKRLGGYGAGWLGETEMTYYELKRYPPLTADTEIESSILTFYKEEETFEVSLTLAYVNGDRENFGSRRGSITGWDEDDKQELRKEAMALLEEKIGRDKLEGQYSWMKNFTGTDLRDRYFQPVEPWRYRPEGLT